MPARLGWESLIPAESGKADHFVHFLLTRRGSVVVWSGAVSCAVSSCVGQSVMERLRRLGAGELAMLTGGGPIVNISILLIECATERTQAIGSKENPCSQQSSPAFVLAASP